MSTILDTIADHARIRVAADKETLSLGELKDVLCAVGQLDRGHSLIVDNNAVSARPRLILVIKN